MLPGLVPSPTSPELFTHSVVQYSPKGDHGKKICIIENEFGEVNIDNALVIDTIEEIFEMNNGCICCNIRGDLVRVLDKIRKRKNKFDAIFIETTGLADPAPVAHTFFMDDGMKEVRLGLSVWAWKSPAEGDRSVYS